MTKMQLTEIRLPNGDTAVREVPRGWHWDYEMDFDSRSRGELKKAEGDAVECEWCDWLRRWRVFE